MNANEVDVGDIVRIVRGNWQGQSGRVETCYYLMSILTEEKPAALFTIRLSAFCGTVITKKSVDVEKIAPAP